MHDQQMLEVAQQTGTDLLTLPLTLLLDVPDHRVPPSSLFIFNTTRFGFECEFCLEFRSLRFEFYVSKIGFLK